MPHHPVKLAENEYILWSTVVDAPISNIMSEDDMYDYLVREGYWCTNEEYVDYTTQQPLTEVGYTWDGKFWIEQSVLEWNRAGPNETSIGVEEIRRLYK